MSTQLCLFNQRWRLRRDSYRPAGEPVNPRLYEVVEVAGDREPKAFILTHHYSASYPSARFRFGLYSGGSLVRSASQPSMQRPGADICVSIESVGQRGTGTPRAAGLRASQRRKLVPRSRVRMPAPQGPGWCCELQRPCPAQHGNPHDHPSWTFWNLLPSNLGHISRANPSKDCSPGTWRRTSCR